MRTPFKILPLIVFLLLINETWAQTNPITDDSPLRTAMPILTVAPDARSSAMGDIGAATAPSINDQAWNCAKYVFNEYDMGVSLSYIPWMRNVGSTNINLLYLTGFYRIDEQQAIAASIRFFSLGTLDFKDDYGNPVRLSNPNEFAIDVSYSLRLGEFFSIGAAFRYLRSDLSGGKYVSTSVVMSPANGVAADVGFFYNQVLHRNSLFSNVSAGLSITNIGTKMGYTYNESFENKHFLPTTLRLAVGTEMNLSYNHSLALSLELSKFLVPTPPIYARDDQGYIIFDNDKPVIAAGKDDKVSVPLGMIQSFYDAPGGFSEELREIMTGLGAEYNYADFFKVRAGFYYDPKNAQHRYVTMGFGIVFSLFTLSKASIDLSYLVPTVSGLQSPLANTIRVTLGVNIGESNKY
ncbi:MAG: type IX secretion system outer membrane channel protein PorV [Prevotellaceae bacterium]|jgi:hypothetical protein|nr:type IX secretion system outer membrane channel protein PorV [Prevotellaceae bacterium]